jgi:hypothetical protein
VKPTPNTKRKPLAPRDLRVARAWVEVQKNWWAFDEVQSALETQPRRAWRLLVRLADLASTTELARDLGCGPLEDFVRAHAPDYIERIEALAAKNANFRRALRAMYFPEGSDAVSRRVLALGCQAIGVNHAPWQVAG